MPKALLKLVCNERNQGVGNQSTELLTNPFSTSTP